ncbi:hypothetical protein [Pelagimonas varians]|uniref:NADH dehydrogenase subunit E n=1 Tax=Pelagimonas varians TaxID=696760 RepID=A0A238JRB5_9RHOB|nr:hypothetical protein [Pelagimonas varians]PYG34628.1 hypothetical protein C8N36_101279 [Pelagimonas varians]SMX33189.1 hypothetical protein PEV8663_00187 [Pelagimonas varians]
MKKLVPALAAMALTTACVMPPKDVTDEDLVAYDAAVASIGCDLRSESDYLPVELQTGLTREKIIEIGQYKLSTEEVVALEGGGVRLVTGACAPTAA